jgi:hypothetical protein
VDHEGPTLANELTQLCDDMAREVQRIYAQVRLELQGPEVAYQPPTAQGGQGHENGSSR